MADLLVYGDIGGYWDDAITALDFADALDKVPTSDSALNIRINSVGGLVSDAVAMRSQLKSYATKRKAFDSNFKVNAYFDGYVFSAATILTIGVADKTIMASGAMYMIHNAWMFNGGNAREMRKAADYLDKVDGNIVDFYVDRTEMKAERVQELMAAETYFTAKEALAAKFVDSIDEETKTEPKASGYDDVKDTILALARHTAPGGYNMFMEHRFASKMAAAFKRPGKTQPAAADRKGFEAYQRNLYRLREMSLSGLD